MPRAGRHHQHIARLHLESPAPGTAQPKYGVTAQDLKSWNDLRRDHISTGQRLRVTSDVVPVAQKGGKTKHAAATRGARKQATTASRKHGPGKPVQAAKSSPRG